MSAATNNSPVYLEEALIYEEGYAVGFRGLSEHSNPYGESSWLSRAWSSGYRDGCSKAREQDPIRSIN